MWFILLAGESAPQFCIKNCLFDVTKTVKNSNKSNYEYSGYGISFDGACLWRFDNGFTRNVAIGVDNSSWSQTDNRKNIGLVSGEGHANDIINASAGKW